MEQLCVGGFGLCARGKEKKKKNKKMKEKKGLELYFEVKGEKWSDHFFILLFFIFFKTV